MVKGIADVQLLRSQFFLGKSGLQDIVVVDVPDELITFLVVELSLVALENPECPLAILVIGVLFIADPDRLQLLMERLRELSAWLAE